MDDKAKAEIKDIMVDVINEVVMPVFETVATKSDLKQLEDKVDRIENKLDRFTEKVTDHEARIIKLEKKSPTLASVS